MGAILVLRPHQHLQLLWLKSSLTEQSEIQFSFDHFILSEEQFEGTKTAMHPKKINTVTAYCILTIVAKSAYKRLWAYFFYSRL